MTKEEVEALVAELMAELAGMNFSYNKLGIISVPSLVNAMNSRTTYSEEIDLSKEDMPTGASLVGYAKYTATENDTSASFNGSADAKLTLSKGNKMFAIEDGEGIEMIGTIAAAAKANGSAKLTGSSATGSGSADASVNYAVNIANAEKKYVKIIGDISCNANASIAANSDIPKVSGGISVNISAYGAGTSALTSMKGSVTLSTSGSNLNIKGSGDFKDINVAVPLDDMGDIMGL